MSDPWDTGKAIDTEARYVAWIRGALRKSWIRYPTQNEYKNSIRVKAPVLDEDGNQKIYKSGKKRGQKVTRWECPCEECKVVFPAAQIQVDHIKSAGNTSSVKELQEFMANLFCGTDNLQLLCKPCHEVKTHMDRYGFKTKEAAIKDKKRIDFFKQKSIIVKKKLKEMGASEEQLRNDNTRRAYYKEKITKEEK